MASLATSPRPDRAVFKHLELIATRGSQVLMVLVLQGGDVRQQMLTLAQVMDQPQLDQTSAMINELFDGKSAEAITAIPNLTDLAQDIAKLVAETMERADAFWTGDVYRDGITNVLSMPEFASSESARSALRLLEERSFLEEVLSNVLSPSVDEVQVVIGGDGDWEDLKDCSMVLARYGAPGFATGALGVLGPTRMSYGRTISAVRYVAGLLSDLVIEAFATDIDNPQ
jgi:heat-inducible transcriptional repressor